MHTDVAGEADTFVLVAMVADQRVALPLRDVVEILPAMALVPLPKGPDVVRGVVNLRGNPLPVLDLRARLDLPERAPCADDHVVVCRVGARAVGVWVDHASEVGSLDADRLVLAGDLPHAEHLLGAAMVADGLLLVHDVRTFLDADEALQLDQALADHDLAEHGRGGLDA